MLRCARLMICLRPSACLAGVLTLAPLLAFSPVRAAAASGPLPPGTAALLAPPSPWSYSADVETAFGYKDNLLLSADGEERSALVRGSVEFLLLRLPGRAFDYSLFAQAGHTHFFAGKAVNHEADAWVQSDVGYRFLDTFKFSLPVTGYYYDQVFDVSDSEVERIVAEMKVAGVMVGPTLRWAFHRKAWFEAQAVGERKRYDDGANDSAIGVGQLRLGWRLGERIEAQIAGGRRWRGFDERVRYNSAGRALADTELKLSEREAEARVDVEWGADRKWRTSTRVSALRRRDNGSGFFSYDQTRVSHDVAWTSDPWLVRLEGSAEQLEFRVQTVGISIDPPPRIKEDYAARLRVERTLTERWTIFAEYSWERSRSNDPISSYSLNEGLLGARWSWEK